MTPVSRFDAEHWLYREALAVARSTDCAFGQGALTLSTGHWPLRAGDRVMAYHRRRGRDCPAEVLLDNKDRDGTFKVRGWRVACGALVCVLF